MLTEPLIICSSISKDICGHYWKGAFPSPPTIFIVTSATRHPCLKHPHSCVQHKQYHSEATSSLLETQLWASSLHHLSPTVTPTALTISPNTLPPNLPRLCLVTLMCRLVTWFPCLDSFISICSSPSQPELTVTDYATCGCFVCVTVFQALMAFFPLCISS